MKYKVKAFSLRALSLNDRVMVLFKGAFYYKLNNKKGTWVFPWHVKQLDVSENDSFPMILWGFRGRKKIKSSDIQTQVPVWMADQRWQHIDENQLSTLSLDTFKESFKCDVPMEIEALHGFSNLNIPEYEVDLSPMVNFTLPESVCNNQK